MQSVGMPSRLALGVALALGTITSVAAEELELGNVEVVGDWLGEATDEDVKNHPGARSVVDQQTIEESGAKQVRELLRKVPGLQVQESNGTGGSDLSLNVGTRGLTARLSPRSTILIDGVPMAFAPYGQPQLSLAPVAVGNLEKIDVVRGGGAVRYGPQNVGGIINFVTREIPETQAGNINVGTEVAGHGGFKTQTSAFLGGTADNGMGAALLYSGIRGAGYRNDNDGTLVDDFMLKNKFALSEIDELATSLHYYRADADMPGGLNAAQFDADPYQSVRPYDSFEGERKDFSFKYTRTPDANRTFELGSYYYESYRGSNIVTERSAVNDQLMSYPRNYHVFGIEPRYSQLFLWGEVAHEVGVGYRYVDEGMHEQTKSSAVYNRASGTPYTTPFTETADNTGGTEAHSVYIDDRIDVGRWTLTPGLRYERVRTTWHNRLKGYEREVNYLEPLPSLNVMYHLSDEWKLYANYNTSFGSLQYFQLGQDPGAPLTSYGNEVGPGLEPEKAHTYELGTRYDNGAWRGEVTLFRIEFDSQLQYAKQDGWTQLGATTHEGIETALSYDLGSLDPALDGLSTYASFTYTKATADKGVFADKDLNFYSRITSILGLRYTRNRWTWNLDGFAQSQQYVADVANGIYYRNETADGRYGDIPGYAIWNARGEYAFGPQLSNLTLGVGVKNLLGHEYFTRSLDNNYGKYLGQPRTLFVQAGVSF
ncbi:TonB-dependent siderophore receptor [Pseudomonas sp. UL073]|uniref:TonB-dependent siderophore receptor n=2 Tax=Zestomonas insulae TaxID=2809017 RepID=A0ABS2IAM1_9GAMM|nr:TonB-dependent siderophore receptor [Pseudomonas insulae]MBM7059713.1 TonB-dependent siderophore receptor [Pseudomonas insulae]